MDKKGYISPTTLIVTTLGILTACGSAYAYLSTQQANASNFTVKNASAISTLQADDANTKANYATLLNDITELQGQISALNQNVINLSQKIQ